MDTIHIAGIGSKSRESIYSAALGQALTSSLDCLSIISLLDRDGTFLMSTWLINAEKGNQSSAQSHTNQYVYIQVLTVCSAETDESGALRKMLAIKATILISLILFVAGGPKYSVKTIEFVLQMGDHFTAGGLVVIFDEDIWDANEEFVDELIEMYNRPLILLQSRRGQIEALSQDKLPKEIVSTDVLWFLRDLEEFLPIYQLVNLNYDVKNLMVILKNYRDEQVDKLLYEIQSESLSVLLDRGRHRSEIRRWTISNRIRIDLVLDGLRKPAKRETLMGRHLTIATLDFPPIVFVKTDGGQVNASGIEPSLMSIIAQRLDFQFSYIVPTNDEMWGTLIFDGPNVTVTGLLGLLHSGRADVAYGDLHMQQRLLPYVDFTQAFRNNVTNDNVS